MRQKSRLRVDDIMASGKNIYIVGIKGAGVSALAQILKAKGYKISGSDTKEKFFTDRLLKKARIPFKEGFSIKNVPQKINFAISSNAYLNYPITNPEIIEIQKRKIPVLSYPEALSRIFNSSFGIAIAGTHGKTTTTAALAFILYRAGFQPNALIGAESVNLKSNAVVGKSDIFILEADEYKDAFLNYKPNIIVILNTDWDHPDYFKTQKQYKNSFGKFKKNIKSNGKIFLPKDIARTRLMAKPSIIGAHNEYDLKAAAAVAKYLGVKKSVIKKCIEEFRGTNRRLEVIGRFKNNTLIDDYAHNPQKVEASLKALKKHYKNREIIVVFQPHTYSRTQQFLKDFAKALLYADRIFLLDIYASARERRGQVTSNKLIKEIQKLEHEAVNLKTIHNAIKFLRKNPPKNSVIVAMGAGDIGDLAYKLAG